MRFGSEPCVVASVKMIASPARHGTGSRTGIPSGSIPYGFGKLLLWLPGMAEKQPSSISWSVSGYTTFTSVE